MGGGGGSGGGSSALVGATALGAAAIGAASARAGGSVRGSTAELMSLFHALCSDESVAVKRSAAAAMADLAAALGSRERVASLLASTYSTLLADEAEPVRIAALGASAAVTEAVALTPSHPVGAMLVAASRDKLPAVRVALAEALPGVARATAAGASLARDLALSLVADVELDVRIAVALQAALLSEGLGAAFIASAVLPTLDVLVRDESVGARVELAGVLMSLARPLGAAGAVARLLPLIHLLLDDANTDVRLSVITCFGEFIDVAGVHCAGADGEGDGSMVEVLRSLGEDGNWRVRHAALLQLPTLAGLMTPPEFRSAFDLDAFAVDRCALVRLDVLKICASIAELPGYGPTWLEAAVLPMLKARHGESKSYERRAVLLEGLSVLAKHMSAACLEDELLPLALSMSNDRVPNLRLQLPQALQRAAAHLSTNTLLGRVIPALEAMELDEDMDVIGAASQALETCLALTHGEH